MISLHVKSAKHGAGIQCLASRDKTEKNIAEMLKEYDQTVHPAGEYLPEPVRVYRVKVLTDFLKAGVAIEKMDMFRDILEENSLRLTCSQRMRELYNSIYSPTGREEITG